MKTLDQYITHPDYIKAFNQAKRNSPILNLEMNVARTTWTLFSLEDKKEEILEEIKYLKLRLVDVKHAFKNYSQQQINEGNRPAEELPPNLLEEFLRYSAKVDLSDKELAIITAKLETFADEKEKQELEAMLKPGQWSTARIKYGVLSSIGGQKVSLNKRNILAINDPRSPYDTLEVWRYKAEVLIPMAKERSFLNRAEEKLAKAEKRLPKKKKVKSPKFNKKMSMIEYPGYHKDWVELQKMKLPKLQKNEK